MGNAVSIKFNIFGIPKLRGDWWILVPVLIKFKHIYTVVTVYHSITLLVSLFSNFLLYFQVISIFFSLDFAVPTPQPFHIERENTQWGCEKKWGRYGISTCQEMTFQSFNVVLERISRFLFGCVKFMCVFVYVWWQHITGIIGNQNWHSYFFGINLNQSQNGRKWFF